MKKELFFRALSGALGGIVICYFITIGISLVMNDGVYYACVPSLVDRFGNEVSAVMVQMGLSAILGAGFAGSSILWEKDEWSLLKQTTIYFSIVSVLMMSVAYVCEWMEHSFLSFLHYFIIFFVIFFVVWVLQYMIWKIRIARINRKIKG